MGFTSKRDSRIEKEKKRGKTEKEKGNNEEGEARALGELDPLAQSEDVVKRGAGMQWVRKKEGDEVTLSV